MMKMKIHIFHIYYYNMDISFIIALICLKICMYIAGICMEGILSQDFDLGNSFCFMLCRKRNSERKYKNSKKLPVLVIK